MANRLVIDWFDGLEATLKTEAQRAGLLRHGSTIGQVREFLVARVLKTILPAGIHVGAGKVIDSGGRESKQIDIIIYDTRFPLMQMEGGGLYLVEGVIATIEIKSTINTDALTLSLENCRSVLELQINGEHPEEAAEQIKFYADKFKISEQEATDMFWYMCRPATYVFAFNSDLSLDGTCRCIASWWQSINCQRSSHFPLLPRAIVSGTVLGITNDGRITLSSADGRTHVMSLFETELVFRWFALHLVDAVSRRLGHRNFAERFDYRGISEYYPFDECVKALSGVPTRFITRTPAPSATP